MKEERRNLSVFFSNFMVGFNDFHLKDIRIIQYDFQTAARKKSACLPIKTMHGLVVALPFEI